MNRNRVLDLDALRAFVLVAELRSFTRTAARLNLTQSAITMRIRRLEEAEGVVLFARGKRMPELTPGATALLPYAKRLLALNDEARSALHGARVVRLGAMEDYATRVLPPVLADFAREAPDITVEVHPGLTPRLLQNLGTRHDLVLAMHRGAGQPGGTPLHPTQAVWASSPSFELPRGEALPLILQEEGCAFRSWALEALQAAGTAWRVAFSSPSQAAVEAAAAGGVGLTVARASTIAPALRVVEGLPKLPVAEIRLHRGAEPSPAASRLAGFLEARLGVPA
jgi:DNA-binding transcriptional LysR family regulator